MTINRRSLLTVLAAGSGVLAMPFAARADSTLEAVKKRGTLRVGVTQAPPWFSKDPKSGRLGRAASASRSASRWPPTSASSSSRSR